MTHKQYLKKEEIYFILIYHNRELSLTYKVIGAVNKSSWEPSIKNLIWYTSIFDLNEYSESNIHI